MEKRHVGEQVEEIEITPEMIQAGVGVLWERFGVVGTHGAEEIGEEVFRAMWAAQPARNRES